MWFRQHWNKLKWAWAATYNDIKSCININYNTWKINGEEFRKDGIKMNLGFVEQQQQANKQTQQKKRELL